MSTADVHLNIHVHGIEEFQQKVAAMTDPIDEIPGIPARYRKSIAAAISLAAGLAALLLTDGYVSGTARHVALIIVAVGTFLAVPGTVALAPKNAEKPDPAKHSLAKSVSADHEARIAALEAQPNPTEVMAWGIDYARVHFGQPSGITIGPDDASDGVQVEAVPTEHVVKAPAKRSHHKAEPK